MRGSLQRASVDTLLFETVKPNGVLDQIRAMLVLTSAKSAKRERAMATIETGDELSIRVLPTGRVRTEWRKARYARPSGLVLFAANESNSARFARLDTSKLRSSPSSMGDALTRFRLRAKKNNRASQASR